MKKFVKMMALATTMAMLFGMTVSAAGSTTTAESEVTQDVLDDYASAIKEYEGIVTIGDKTVSYTTNAGALPKATFDAAVEVRKGLTDIKLENKTFEAKGIVSAFDLLVPELSGKLETAVEIVMNVPMVKTGKNYVVLHQRSDNGQWETLPATVKADGQLSAYFDCFSPVAVVEIAEKAAPPQDNGGSSDTSDNGGSNDAPAETAVSPKTGEALPMAGILAVICLAGAVFCTGKLSFKK